MMWKLIKALVKRIKAWYSLRNRIERLYDKTEDEIKRIKENMKQSVENEILLYHLNNKKEEYRSILRQMNDYEYTKHYEEEVL